MVRKMETAKVTEGVKVCVYIPKEWHEKMKELAQANRLSISDVYRLAVSEFLMKYVVVRPTFSDVPEPEPDEDWYRAEK